MANKRKSDVLTHDADNVDASEHVADAPASKKTRTAGTTSTSSGESSGSKKFNSYTSWEDVKLEGEDEGEVCIYDDCNDVRRKIRALMKMPGWKVTHWLRDIGDINSNSYRRFMKDSGPACGATNGTYLAAYIYFEKVRIFEGKKKSAKRLRMEAEHPNGLELRDRRHVWVFTGR